MRSVLFFVLSMSLLGLYAQDVTTVAVIGCHDQHRPAPVIPYLANVVQPDYTVWIGDNVYADTEDDPGHIQAQLDVLAAKDGFARLRAVSRFVVTWDDHDYGLNNAGGEYPLKEQSLAIHRAFWQLEDLVPADRDGIYNAFIDTLTNGHTIQFIALDARYNRTARGRGHDMLGEAQWAWLEDQLTRPADLRFVLSGQQILLGRSTVWESWSKYPRSKRRLVRLIRDTGAEGVVFITGDQHYVEVLRSPGKLGYDAYEVMAAGINKNEVPWMAFRRVAGPDVTIHSAPLLTVHWAPTNGLDPHIEVTVTDVESGEMTLRSGIPFSGIQRQ